jgi:hypothetical protein
MLYWMVDVCVLFSLLFPWLMQLFLYLVLVFIFVNLCLNLAECPIKFIRIVWNYTFPSFILFRALSTGIILIEKSWFSRKLLESRLLSLEMLIGFLSIIFDFHVEIFIQAIDHLAWSEKAIFFVEWGILRRKSDLKFGVWNWIFWNCNFGSELLLRPWT